MLQVVVTRFPLTRTLGIPLLGVTVTRSLASLVKLSSAGAENSSVTKGTLLVLSTLASLSARFAYKCGIGKNCGIQVFFTD